MSYSEISSEFRRRAVRGLTRFWLDPASVRPLAILRISVAAVLLFQALASIDSVRDLYGRDAVVSWDALQSVGAFPMSVDGPFHLSFLSRQLSDLGISADHCVMGVFGLYVAALAGLLLGFQSRLSAVLAFMTHLLLTETAPATTYGVDQFARIALFYSCWLPIGNCLSIDHLIRPGLKQTTTSARIGLRMLQLHLAVMYLATGLHKAAGEQWWNGEAIWRAVTLPGLAQFDMSWLAGVPLLPMLIGWATLAIEIGYCVFVWHARTRRITAAAAVGMHAGIAVQLGLTSFALLMIALNVAAFLVPPKTVEQEQAADVPCFSNCSGFVAVRETSTY